MLRPVRGREPAPAARVRDEVRAVRDRRFGPATGRLRLDPPGEYSWPALASVPRDANGYFPLFEAGLRRNLKTVQGAVEVLRSGADGKPSLQLRPEPAGDQPPRALLAVDAGEFADFEIQLRVVLPDPRSNLGLAWRQRRDSRDGGPGLALLAGTDGRPGQVAVWWADGSGRPQRPAVERASGEVVAGRAMDVRLTVVGRLHRLTVNGTLVFEEELFDEASNRPGHLLIAGQGGDVQIQGVRLAVFDGKTRPGRLRP